MGSGKLVTKAIAKHGLENFRKHIIKEFDTSEEAFEFEKSIVTEEFVADKNTYNLVEGGFGTFSGANGWYAKHPEHRLETLAKMRAGLLKRLRTDEEFRMQYCNTISLRTKRLFAEGKLKNFRSDWTGNKAKKHTQESKDAIGRANAVHQSGAGNSQFGTVWIRNEEHKNSKRVKKEDLQHWLDNGWIIGRKMMWT